MGSGMLPPGAYVTLEHEYILILRKGPKREFKRDSEKQNRRQSAFFWEERNAWFSDVWMDVKGTSQHLGDHAARLRSAAFPFNVPYRLINMFSVKGDLVVDPFLGIGTTMWAAMTSGRNCVGYEIEKGLRNEIYGIADSIVGYANQHIDRRIQTHVNYVRRNQGKFKYTNRHHHFSVKTRQEMDMFIHSLTAIRKNASHCFEVVYSTEMTPSF
jgi:DNA modification methylase